MKIVILGTRGFPNVQGGVERHCEELSVRLVKLDCEVIVLTRKPYVNTNIKEYHGVKLVALPTVRHKVLEAFFHTFVGVFTALSFKPDIIHFQAIGPSFFVPLAKIMGMKVVMTSHGSNYKHMKWGKLSKIALRLCEFLGITFANKIIAISKVIADEIKAKYNRAATIIPNGVDILEISESTSLLDKFSLKPKKYILAVGRFVPEKGFSDLVDAYMQADLDGWKLAIVGGADHESEYSVDLKEKAKKNGNIVLTGVLSDNDIKELYSHAGLFVLPSYYEGLPISLLEAMSYGLQCIVSNIPANRSLGLDDEKCFTPGNTEEIAQKLNKFTQKDLTKTERKIQIDMIREKYNWSNIAKKTVEVYREVSS